MKKVKEFKIVNDTNQDYFEQTVNSCLADGWKILKVETVVVGSGGFDIVVRFIAHLIRSKKVD